MTKKEKDKIEKEIFSDVGYKGGWVWGKDKKLTPEGWLEALKHYDQKHYEALETASKISRVAHNIRRVLRGYYKDLPDGDSKLWKDREE